MKIYLLLNYLFCLRTDLQFSEKSCDFFARLLFSPLLKQRVRDYNHIFFLDWFSQQTEFSTRIEEMEKIELGKCLEKFYLSARQKDGGYYKEPLSEVLELVSTNICKVQSWKNRLA